MIVYLIRHGETEHNAARVMQRPDAPLSARGREQARRLAERLTSHAERCAQPAGEAHSEGKPSEVQRLGAERSRIALAGGIAAILSSDYARAAETARILAERCNATLELDPLLRERNFGELRGRAYASFDFDPFAPDYVPPGGESVARFHERVAAAWASVEAAAEAGPLAVVTHGLVCRAMVSRHARLAPGLDASEARWRNTSLSVLHGPTPFEVRLLDSVEHLEGMDEAEAPAPRGGAPV